MRHNSLRARGPELWIAGGLVAVTFAMSWTPRLFSVVGSVHQHLGGEYYNIARALVDGRGYSDPFGEVTGSTAWMPPIYTYLLAALLLALGKKSLVAAAMVTLTNVSLAGVGFAVYRLATRTKRSLPPFFALGLYLLWLSAFYYWFFQFTHDVWLVMSVCTLVVIQVERFVGTGEVPPYRWGLLGGVAYGTSPAIALAWGGLTCVGIVTQRRHRRALFGSLVLALALATPWTVRNAVVFGQFIPGKSNYFFDAYQANYSDTDGIIDPRTTFDHPYQCNETRFTYGELGETKSMAEFRAKYLAAVRDDPGVLLAKSARRALTATLWYSPFLDVDTGLPLTLRRVVFAVPFLGFLIAFAGDHRRLLALLGFVYFAYLAPYVVTTMHIRYLLPLTPLCVLFAYWGLDMLVRRATQSRPSQWSQVRWSLPRSKAEGIEVCARQRMWSSPRKTKSTSMGARANRKRT